MCEQGMFRCNTLGSSPPQLPVVGFAVLCFPRSGMWHSTCMLPDPLDFFLLEGVVWRSGVRTSYLT
jgi:hypothetical protein